jgi:protein translocase SecG subunit
MDTPFSFIIKIIYLLVCIVLVVLTLFQNRRSEGLGAAITGQTDTSRGAMGREEKLAQLIRDVSWAFLISSFFVALILRQLWH